MKLRSNDFILIMESSQIETDINDLRFHVNEFSEDSPLQPKVVWKTQSEKEIYIWKELKEIKNEVTKGV